MGHLITTATGQPAQNSPCHSFAIHNDFDGCENVKLSFLRMGNIY